MTLVVLCLMLLCAALVAAQEKAEGCQRDQEDLCNMTYRKCAMKIGLICTCMKEFIICSDTGAARGGCGGCVVAWRGGAAPSFFFLFSFFWLTEALVICVRYDACEFLKNILCSRVPFPN